VDGSLSDDRGGVGADVVGIVVVMFTTMVVLAVVQRSSATVANSLAHSE